MQPSADRNMVLAYHEVMPESNYAYCVTSASFAEQLRLLDSLKKTKSLDAQITFDDGEQSQFHNALPLLAEHGFKATYFVTPGLIGTAAKFLGWDDLRALQAAGIPFSRMAGRTSFLRFVLKRNLLTSCARQNNPWKIISAVRWKKYRFQADDGTGKCIHACAAAGYRRVYVSDPWVETEIGGVEVIGRFMVRRTTTIPELEKIVGQRSKCTAQIAPTLAAQGRLGGSVRRQLIPPALVPIDWIQRV